MDLPHQLLSSEKVLKSVGQVVEEQAYELDCVFNLVRIASSYGLGYILLHAEPKDSFKDYTVSFMNTEMTTKSFMSVLHNGLK